MRDNIKADDIAGLAKMFGVNFTQKDNNTLQKWMQEESKQTNNQSIEGKA